MSMTKVALLLLDDYITPEGVDFADLGEQVLRSALTRYVPDKSNDTDSVEFTKFDYIRDNANLPPLLDGGKCDYDVIYLTGSRRDSYDDIPFNSTMISFLKSVISHPESKTKLLGICFGHQLIARALGLTTLPNSKGWEMGNTVIKITDDEYNRLANTNIPREFVISEMHRDIVSTPLSEKQSKDLSKLNIHPFGYSAICSVQGFYKRGKLLSFQGHPEFTSKLTNKMIGDRLSKGIVDEAFYKDASARNQNLHEDGSDPQGELKLQKWIAEFIFE